MPQQDKWTEIEHLPEWDEEFYDVYTAKKYGKWVMLKTLKPELRERPDMLALIGREFDVRYNLAHPNIVMINDFEEVPGLGMCIITDDVYGTSLRTLITRHEVTEGHLQKVTHELVEAIEYIQANHLVHQPIKPERILFTENVGNLKLIDVGFDQKNCLQPSDISEDLRSYGAVLTETLDALDEERPRLRLIARRCSSATARRHYPTVNDLHLALQGRRNSRLLLWVVAFLAVMIVVLAWLSSPYAPARPPL